ncbi:MAG: hypothetical protein E5V27_30105 [Mesorhizobium sp.]|nr:MAG: hypothetical protein E5V27_30105 [Mesorhizobium sp.]
MPRVVEPLDEDDETLLQLGRKPSDACSEGAEGQGAIVWFVNAVGEDQETLLQLGSKPCHACSEAP